MKVRVKVIPSSKRAKVDVAQNGVLVVKVNAPPQKGLANKRLVEVLADYFRIPKSSVKIIHGFTSKMKLVEIKKIKK